MILVCALDQVPAAVAAYAPRSVITLLDTPPAAFGFAGIAPERHLKVARSMSPHPATSQDAASITAQLVPFAKSHDWDTPLLVHCQLGISRSPAAAFIIQCALSPDIEEVEIAIKMQRLASYIEPNYPMIVEADTLLGRQGRMMNAIDKAERMYKNEDMGNYPNPIIIPYTPQKTNKL